MAASGNVRYSQIRTGDRTGSGNRIVTAASGTLTQNVPLLYDSSGNVIATATRSGNTTEFATITGTKTTGKQLEFDASGNIKASASDIGGGGGGGGLVFIEEQVASTSATLNFTSTISSTYDEYMFEFINVIPATDNQAFYMRVSTDGGSTWKATNYSHATLRWNSGGNASAGGLSQTEIRITQATGASSNTAFGICGHTRLFSPLSTSVYTRVDGHTNTLVPGAGSSDAYITFGAWQDTTAVDAVQFYFASGNIASGIIRSYGFAKS